MLWLPKMRRSKPGSTSSSSPSRSQSLDPQLLGQEMRVLQGLVEEFGGLINRLSGSLGQLEGRLVSLEAQTSRHEDRLGLCEERWGRLADTTGRHEGLLGQLDGQVGRLEGQVAEAVEKAVGVEEHWQSLVDEIAGGEVVLLPDGTGPERFRKTEREKNREL
jgi:hypothetical protein